MPARIPLDGVDLVTFGRGEARSVRVAAGTRRVTVEVGDPRMSTKHARIAFAGGRYVLEDLGSKNGTLLAGEPVRTATLEDGDVFELGETFFVFRMAKARALTTAAPAHPNFDTCSPDLSLVFDGVAAIASAPISVVVRGPSGSGKELVARALHELSGRTGAYVAVNCGALADGVVHSELFGHKRGAFSGATENRLGAVRTAEGGTLFLDEIGDMPEATQAILLRVLQEREVTPVGASEPLKVDLRVVAATHRDVPRMIEDGRFRADLWARLSGFEVLLPPLCERSEDIGLLIAKLLDRHALSSTLGFEPEAARRLFGYSWPLNVRELEQCLVRAFALAKGEPVALDHLAEAVRSAAPRTETRRTAGPGPSGAALADRDVERNDEDRALEVRLVALLEEHRGNVSRVAEALGKDRKQIRRWIERFSIDVERFRTL